MYEIMNGDEIGVEDYPSPEGVEAAFADVAARCFLERRRLHIACRYRFVCIYIIYLCVYIEIEFIFVSDPIEVFICLWVLMDWVSGSTDVWEI